MEIMNAVAACLSVALVLFVALLIVGAIADHKSARRYAARIAQEKAQDAARNAAKTVQPAKPSQPEAPKRKRGRPRKTLPAAPAAPVVQKVPPMPTPRPATIPAKPSITGNNAFAGECVAFSGTIPGMTRAEAIRAVEANGGQAFENMPACTTLLVMGEHPGYYKRERANGWGVKMISAEAFKIRIMQPLTLSPDEFAAMYAA